MAQWTDGGFLGWMEQMLNSVDLLEQDDRLVSASGMEVQEEPISTTKDDVKHCHCRHQEIGGAKARVILRPHHRHQLLY